LGLSTILWGNILREKFGYTPIGSSRSVGATAEAQ
jgi:hypothetical protein